MAEITVAEMSAEQIQEQLASPNKGYETRAPYREAISSLRPGQTLRIRPGADESKRAIQFRIVGAAREVNINVKYGDDKDGDILVWLDNSPDASMAPKRRRKKSDAESGNGVAEMPEPVAV